MTVNSINSDFVVLNPVSKTKKTKCEDDNIFAGFGNTYMSSQQNTVNIAPENEVDINTIKEDFKKTKSEQGLFGFLWDGFKNITGIGASSNKAQKAIEKYENGEISQEEMLEAVNGYKEGQKSCVDMVADIISGVVSFGAFALATGIGIAASPFTGGASLGLVAAGFAFAGVAGGASKVLVKGFESVIGGKNYDSFGYDFATGAINGVFAPVSAGVGAAAGKAVATGFGVAVKEGAEVVLKEGLEHTVRGGLTRVLLNTNVTYKGGSLIARMCAMGTDMAVDGAISGAVDSASRYVATDSEDKSFKGFMSEVATGTIGGFILSPVIGGSTRAVGKGIGKFTTKLNNKVSTNYTAARTALENVCSCESPDADMIREFGDLIYKSRHLLDDFRTKQNLFIEDVATHTLDMNNNVYGILSDLSILGHQLNEVSNSHTKVIVELLEQLAQGKDVSDELLKRINALKALTTNGDKKVTDVLCRLDEQVNRLMQLNQLSGQKIVSATDSAYKFVADASEIAQGALSQAEKLQKTQAFKQLGDLPERIRLIKDEYLGESAKLDKIATSVHKKVQNGEIIDSIDDIAECCDAIDSYFKKMQEIFDTVSETGARSGIDENISVVQSRLQKLMQSDIYKSLPRDKQFQLVIEESNILLAKFAQTYSSSDALPDEVLDILKQFTSNCPATRTIAEAQQFADELYGAGKYEITRSFGAGTVGETYLANPKAGEPVVIKMLKKGVSKEKFEQDRALFVNYINEFITDEAEKEYKLKLINGMFDAWERELDFSLEAKNAFALADGAKRFKVAQPVEVGIQSGKNVSLVLEKANGVKLDDLLEMIKLYKTNPDEYFVTYADDIKKISALANPQSWMADLSKAYQKAQNEQVMFVGSSGVRTIHADPHPGNVFIDFNPKTGKPSVVYIDTGNVVQRTNSQTLQDLGLSINMLLGNSQGIAHSFLQGATLPSDADYDSIAKRFAQLLDEKLYKAGVNLKNTQYVQNTINAIMKELNIVPDMGNSNLMKATLQRIETSRAINSACDSASSKIADIKDMLLGLLKSANVSPVETIDTIRPILQWAYQNNDLAMITFLHMIMKKAS